MACCRWVRVVQTQVKIVGLLPQYTVVSCFDRWMDGVSLSVRNQHQFRAPQEYATEIRAASGINFCSVARDCADPALTASYRRVSLLHRSAKSKVRVPQGCISVSTIPSQHYADALLPRYSCRSSRYWSCEFRYHYVLFARRDFRHVIAKLVGTCIYYEV